jgi:ribosomal protein S18 acetylase RimI-like enzyme
VFEAWGARRFPRQFLIGQLDELGRRLEKGRAPAVRPFRGSDLKAGAHIVHRSFVGSRDAEMSDCYRTLEGCESFIEGVLLRNGCGTYEPRASFVAVEEGAALGVVLSSRISPTIGHVVQISVDPAAQRRGIGTGLMGAAAGALRRQGFTHLSLSVTVGNTVARSWYLALGMRPIKDFNAYVWQRP